jgi:hypothetical protein
MPFMHEKTRYWNTEYENLFGQGLNMNRMQ